MTEEIDTAEAAHVAALARLELSEDELERFAHELSLVLEHVQTIRRLDLGGVKPTVHAIALQNVLREDVVRPGVSRKDVLDVAPSVEDHRFRVPRILGEAP